jgi:hypothetical protein
VLADYVQTLPAGSLVKVHRSDARAVRGTLLKATDQFVVVQPRTRVPEPPVEIPLDTVISVTLETRDGGSIGKAIAIGAAAGAGAALAVFLIIAAIYAD